MSITIDFSWILVLYAIVWLLAFVSLSHLQWIEAKVRKQMDAEIFKIIKEPVPVSIKNGQIRNINNIYEPEIERIKRSREFVRDIIPFLKN